MAIKPWYNVVTPREDLREGKPLDAAEFAVHLDHIRDGRAQEDYQNPERFFERTFLTKNLISLTAEVIRRLSGEITETSAVFNMSTQFGGGKTHALTLLYHLAKHGSRANSWMGVNELLQKANISNIPEASIAVFVGTEFDSIRGRGGRDNTPLRLTPWGEIAYQLRGDEGFEIVREHDNRGIAPAGDVIKQLLHSDKPCLILMDEVMNYFGRNRKSGLSTQFYDFIHNLSETVRGERNVVLVVSIPKSEIWEMSAEDESDYSTLKKLLDRLGKAASISSENETSEIIRRRLFEWDARAVSQDGRVLLPKEAIAVCNEYADWILDHRQQIPNWFPIDNARQYFVDTYPFHPIVLSVFERKWQSLPRFQQTRGILRLLAMWVSNAYQKGFKGAHRDGLIGLGTAPLDDSLFRRAVFEQLGEDKLEGAITTDISGKSDSFSIRLDKEAVDTIKKARLHQKVATSIFFESSGGQQRKEATLPELRLAVAEPDLDIGNVETVLEELSSNCYYLTVDKNRYRFSLTPNLNKLLSDRRANVQQLSIEEKVKEEIQRAFASQSGIEKVLFPERSNQVPDRPALTIVLLSPEKSLSEKETLPFIELVTREYGNSGRTFKTALIWAVAESSAVLNEEARKLLAWEDIKDNDFEKLDDSQKRQLSENLKKAKRDLTESVWRAYKNIAILGKDNKICVIDFGLVHSSSSDTLANFIITRLRESGEVEEAISPNFLVRNWPPAHKEWSTKSVRDAFFASPIFPRLMNVEKLKDTISRGVANGILAYVGKGVSGKYDPFYFETQLDPLEIEFTDDMFIVTAEEARKNIEPPKLSYLEIKPQYGAIKPGQSFTFSVRGLDQFGQEFSLDKVTWSSTGGEINEKGVFKISDGEGEYIVSAQVDNIKAESRISVSSEKREPIKPEIAKAESRALSWTGEIPPLKWMNFYTKVIAKFANMGGLKIRVNLDIPSTEGLSNQKIEETKLSLKELGLDDNLK